MIEPMPRRRSLFLHILLTGLVAGTMDIVAALVNYSIHTGHNPVNVLKFVASGLVGSRAFGEDPVMPYIGLLVHYFIAFSWVIFFFVGYNFFWRKIPTLLLQAVLFGCLVFLVMNYVVLPLSTAPPLKKTVAAALLEATILIVCIGLPCAVGVRRYTRG